MLACFANCKDQRVAVARRAEAFLREARKWEPSVIPNHVCYNAILNLWGRAAKPVQAEAVFLEMCEDFKQGNKSAQPETSTFNSKWWICP